MNYQKAYENLKKFVTELTPYCDTCKNVDTESGCDGCNRKSFNWELDSSVIDRINKDV